MDRFIATLLRVALNPVVKTLVGAFGPAIRGLQSVKLEPSEISAVLALVSRVYNGETVSFSPMGQLTALELQDVVEGLHESMVAVLTDYRITLTSAQCATILAAVAVRIPLRHADSVVA